MLSPSRVASSQRDVALLEPIITLSSEAVDQHGFSNIAKQFIHLVIDL